MSILLTGARVFDGHSADVRDGQSVHVEDGLIREVGERITAPADVRHIDVDGMFVTPGLIDAHFHAYGVDVSPQVIDRSRLAGPNHQPAINRQSVRPDELSAFVRTGMSQSRRMAWDVAGPAAIW
jgi:imidazolonepropionase-like amidohydrolase